MRFGPVPVAEALGGILAHTYRVSGVAMPKGTRLGPAELEALGAAGLAEVVVARLDPDDLHEDEAARQVAMALAGDTLRATEPQHGRVNLHAAFAGVLGVNEVGVHDLNLVHESITLATLAPWARVAEGELVATVKVIPFAAARHVVDACFARGAGALEVYPLRLRTAGLVATTLPGSSRSLVEKAVRVQRARLEALGSRLGPVHVCAHTPAAIEAALQELLSQGCDPLLLLGASATVDRHDVLPSAIRAVGGVVDHLGMPMDPGNQLFLAHLGSVVAIGVPGCARSPAPGGFDVVLRRVLAGQVPTRHDLMRLGVGGLVKQKAARRSRRGRVAGIVLAAGQSRRMGAVNKLLAEVEGVPMVVRAVQALSASEVVDVVVVTGHQAAEVREALAGRPVRFVHNPDHAEGMSTSVRAGFEAVQADPDLDGALVALGDMPYVTTEHIDALLAAFDPDDPLAICVPAVGTRRGHPVLWGRGHFEAMGTLTGDRGARQVLDAHAEHLVPVAIADDGVLVDIDTPEALPGG